MYGNDILLINMKMLWREEYMRKSLTENPVSWERVIAKRMEDGLGASFLNELYGFYVYTL